MSKDYNLQMKVRNGPLLEVMRDRGFESANHLARESKTSPSEVGVYLNLKQPPVTKEGEWRAGVLRIAKTLRALPEDLFPEQHIRESLPCNVTEVEMSLDDIMNLPQSAIHLVEEGTPESEFDKQQLKGALQKALSCLTPRERKIIQSRFPADDNYQTLHQVGDNMGISVDRVRQIEVRALSKMQREGYLGGFKGA